MIYLGNAFSLNMLQDEEATVKIKRVGIEELEGLDSFESVIGHEGTAAFVSSLLKKEVKANRVPIKLSRGDKLYVVQISIRLSEGQVLSHEEVISLYREGKVCFYSVEII